MPSKKQQPGFVPQPRDFRLLRGLFHCRILTIKHAAALFFDGSEEAAGKRLQKLVAAKIVRRREGKVSEPNIYEFTGKAFKLLQDYRELNEYAHIAWTEAMDRRARVSKEKLLHELDVMSVLAALYPAIQALPGFRVVEFGTWPKLYQFTLSREVMNAKGYISEKPTVVRPDGFLRVSEIDSSQKNDYYDAFLEVDRGSESRKTLHEKARLYYSYYYSGAFAELHGHAGAKNDDFPFRVLFVLQGPERLNNFCERLLRENRKGATQDWLTTLPELLANPLGKIWIRPRDYIAAVEGTPFDPIGKKETRYYIPNPQREKYVSDHVRKWGLFEDPSQ